MRKVLPIGVTACLRGEELLEQIAAKRRRIVGALQGMEIVIDEDCDRDVGCYRPTLIYRTTTWHLSLKATELPPKPNKD